MLNVFLKASQKRLERKERELPLLLKKNLAKFKN
jgi:hypothetical protein